MNAPAQTLQRSVRRSGLERAGLYYDTDAVHTLEQNGISTTYTLDLAGRRHSAQTTGGSIERTLVRHDTDGSDNPGWVAEIEGNTSTTTRYAETLGGAAAIEITDGTATLRLANPHRDTITTATVPAAGPSLSITGWSDYDEYGNPRADTAANNVAGAGQYAWLGGKERATDDTGLILMGARLYNPVAGVFSSLDPIAGGNATGYSYPNDPVNFTDITGLAQDPGQYVNSCKCTYSSMKWRAQLRSYVAESGWVGIDDAARMMGGARFAEIKRALIDFANGAKWVLPASTRSSINSSASSRFIVAVPPWEVIRTRGDGSMNTE